MARRQHLTLTLIVAVVLFFSISYLFSSTPRSVDGFHLHNDDAPRAAAPAKGQTIKEAARDAEGFKIDIDDLPSLEGDSIAPKLENATLKLVLRSATVGKAKQPPLANTMSLQS